MTPVRLQRWKASFWLLGSVVAVGGALAFFFFNLGWGNRPAKPGKADDFQASSASGTPADVSAEERLARSNRQDNVSGPREKVRDAADFYRPIEMEPKAEGAAPPVPTNLSAEEQVVQYKNQADELRKKGQFREAIELCRKALEIKPDDEELHFNLAFIFAKTGATNEAYAHYTKALEIFPEYSEAHNNLGNLLLAQGRLDEAVEHFKAVIAISPDNEKAHNNLGIVLSRQGKTKEAAAHFSKVIRLNPDYLEARFNLARVALLLQDTNTAEIQFSEMLKHTNKVIAHNLVGTVLAQAGEVSRAETHYAEALRLNPDSVESRYNLARVWLQLGEKDKAIAALREILRARPNFQPAEQALRLAEASRSQKSAIPSTNAPPSRPLPAPATNEAPSAPREKAKTD